MADENATSILSATSLSLTKDPKPVADFSDQLSSLFQDVDLLLNENKIAEAIDSLLVLEKKARQGFDAISTSKLACRILNIYKEKKIFDEINIYIVFLCKKRGQLKRVIIDMIRLCMTWINNTNVLDEDFFKQNPAIRLKLINTLCEVTDGKMFVEVERARLIRILSKIKEEDGDIDEAANIIQDIQVETYGGFEKEEKCEYILNQMRILLLKKDYIRCQIISKKISKKIIQNEDMQLIKLEYYKYMIQYYIHENMLIDVCNCYYNVYYTLIILQNRDKWMNALQCYILYLILSPYEITQRDMLLRVQQMEKKKIAEMPVFENLLNDFLKVELIPWPVSYEDEIKNHAVFQTPEKTFNDEFWSMFRKRVLQHNIKVISTYFTRITMNRLVALLGITMKEGETEISELVYAKAIQAKIDRPKRIVCFGDIKNTCDTLNDWSGDISKLLNLVDESSHLIQKQKMIEAAKAKKIQVDSRINI